MFLAIIIIILGACISILWSIYYNTIAIQKSYGTVNAYYWAYYWAITAMERWLLMSKLKYPTYVGEWWFKWDTAIWAKSELFSWEFWKLNQWNNTISWSVDSLTDHITGTIDTKTVRAISFEKYNDSNLNWYTGGTYGWTNGLSTAQSFSWTTNPSNWWRSAGTLTGNVDFDRFFWLNNSGKVLRGLLTTNYDGAKEKDAPLTGNFEFSGGAKNPRPALTGIHKQ